jgi:6-phosphogluconolactonase
MSVPEIRIYDGDRFADEAAAALVELIDEAIEARGGCRFALSGGGTPGPVYQRMAASDRLRVDAIDWYFGDDRAVPPDHEASNYRMARHKLFDPAGVASARVHRMQGELGAEAGAAAYAEVIGSEPMDVNLLGMGGDGHTASLFPGAELDPDAVVVATRSPVPPKDRISMGLGAINASRVVVLLVAGEGKAGRLAEVRQQMTAGNPVLPMAMVRPTSGRYIWLLDRAAANNLEESR